MKNLIFIIPLIIFAGCSGEMTTNNPSDKMKPIYHSDYLSISELTYDTNKYIVITTGHGVAICPKTENK